MTIRILIADDHGVVREGLGVLLGAEPDMEVIGEVLNGREAVSAAVHEEPDLLLMDVSMPESGGIEATRRIKEVAPQVRVLMLTMHEDTELLREAIRAGASGYILKRAIKSELIHAIETVMRDQLYLHPVMARHLLTNGELPQRPQPSEEKPLDAHLPLTPREIDVLRLLAQGYTNRQSAEKLDISVRTVEFHRANLTNKLGLQGRLELMRYAEEKGLV